MSTFNASRPTERSPPAGRPRAARSAPPPDTRTKFGSSPTAPAARSRCGPTGETVIRTSMPSTCWPTATWILPGTSTATPSPSIRTTSIPRRCVRMEPAARSSSGRTSSTGATSTSTAHGCRPAASLPAGVRGIPRAAPRANLRWCRMARADAYSRSRTTWPERRTFARCAARRMGRSCGGRSTCAWPREIKTSRLR